MDIYSSFGLKVAVCVVSTVCESCLRASGSCSGPCGVLGAVEHWYARLTDQTLLSVP